MERVNAEMQFHIPIIDLFFTKDISTQDFILLIDTRFTGFIPSSLFDYIYICCYLLEGETTRTIVMTPLYGLNPTAGMWKDDWKEG